RVEIVTTPARSRDARARRRLPSAARLLVGWPPRAADAAAILVGRSPADVGVLPAPRRRGPPRGRGRRLGPSPDDAPHRQPVAQPRAGPPRDPTGAAGR